MSGLSPRLDHADSLHPTLHLDLTAGILSALPAEECQPAVVVRLPPALFIDPNDFTSTASIASLRYLNSTQPSLASYDFTRVELEKGVGYTEEGGSSSSSTSSREGRSSAAYRAANPVAAREVKRVKKGQYVVAAKGSGYTRYQDAHADAQDPLAKETRAVLLTLNKEKKKKESTTKREEEEEVEYDALTGLRSSAGAEDKVIPLRIPLHARYVTPRQQDLSWRSLWTDGLYEKVTLDKPEMVWMCSQVAFVLDSDVYEEIAPSDLLPSPHSHLSLQFSPSEEQWVFHRLRIPSQESPFEIRIPAGNASLAPHVQLVTLLSLLVASLWTVVQVRSILSSLPRKGSV